MKFTVRKQSLLLSAIFCFAVLTISGIAFYGFDKLAHAMNRTDVMAAALRSHMTADMMHDALRADVLRAMRKRCSRPTLRPAQAAF